jgi:hypothetical protein
VRGYSQDDGNHQRSRRKAASQQAEKMTKKIDRCELKSLRKRLADCIEGYFNGTESLYDLRRWALLDLIEYEPKEGYPQDDSYWIFMDAVGALILASPSEPDEYRTTDQELVQVVAYLRGEAPFPKNRIPQDNLEGVRGSIAEKIEEYLSGGIDVSALAHFTGAKVELLDKLNLKGTPGHDSIIDAVTTIQQLRGASPEDDVAARDALRLSVHVLRTKSH